MRPAIKEYPNLIETTIIQVPSEFSGYNGLIQKYIVSTKI